MSSQDARMMIHKLSSEISKLRRGDCEITQEMIANLANKMVDVGDFLVSDGYIGTGLALGRIGETFAKLEPGDIIGLGDDMRFYMEDDVKELYHTFISGLQEFVDEKKCK